jgi:hypothetical protein
MIAVSDGMSVRTLARLPSCRTFEGRNDRQLDQRRDTFCDLGDDSFRRNPLVLLKGQLTPWCTSIKQAGAVKEIPVDKEY